MPHQLAELISYLHGSKSELIEKYENHNFRYRAITERNAESLWTIRFAAMKGQI